MRGGKSSAQQSRSRSVCCLGGCGDNSGTLFGDLSSISCLKKNSVLSSASSILEGDESSASMGMTSGVMLGVQVDGRSCSYSCGDRAGVRIELGRKGTT